MNLIMKFYPFNLKNIIFNENKKQINHNWKIYITKIMVQTLA